MKFENEHERKIYQSGFFAGKNSVTPKPNYTQEELEDIEDIIFRCFDTACIVFNKNAEKFTKVPKWFRKIPLLKLYYEKKLAIFIEANEIVNFIGYIRAKTIPEYLDVINTRKENK